MESYSSDLYQDSAFAVEILYRIVYIFCGYYGALIPAPVVGWDYCEYDYN